MEQDDEDIKKALKVPDGEMRRLANKILENSCESGAYWQLCAEVVE